MNVINQQQFCEKYGITLDQAEGGEWICGDLTMYEETISFAFTPKVTGNLSLPKLKELKPWFNPVVGRNLYLPSVISLDQSFNPVVGGWLELNSLIEIPWWCTNHLTVGGLFLPLVKHLPYSFRPTTSCIKYHLCDNHSMYHGCVEEDFRGQAMNGVYSWRDGKYLMVHGFMCEVV